MVKRTNADWLKLIDEYMTSGLTQESWCKSRSINFFTFRDRLSKIKNANGSKAPNDKGLGMEVKPAEPVGWIAVKTETKTAAAVCNIEVNVGSFSIQVPRDFEEATLGAVCRVLKSLC